jgi:hypothetical protein
MAIRDAYAHGKDANPRADGRNLPAGAIKAHDIRGQVQDWQDPYLRDEEKPAKPSVCEECGSVFANGRWYEAQDAPLPPGEVGQLPKVLCPADRRKRDRLPAGIVSLSGSFFAGHRQTIEELVTNEAARARATNPMERIIGRSSESGALTVETTTPTLAQRIGHALDKAYHGDVVYKWSENDHLARVEWRRDD